MRVVFAAAWLCGLLLGSAAYAAEEPDPADTFPTSLHATRAGKEHFYRKALGGFERLTGIPASELKCGACHAAIRPDGKSVDTKAYEPSCKDCHKKDGDKVADDVCLGCHQRQLAEHKLTRDVHRDWGMKCAECHGSREMHGDGKRYVSMLQPGAMDANCENCHGERKLKPNKAHRTHNATVDCKACHAATVITCNNCHFESELAGGGKRFFAPPMRDFMFLLRREGSGKVHPATMQSLIYRDRTFVTFAPYSPHTISDKARPCGDCHGNANLKAYARTGKIQITRWDAKEATVKGIEGVVPFPPDWREAVQLDFVTYTGDPARAETDPRAWKFVKHGADLMQMLFAEPLSAEQIQKLLKPQK